nr:ATP-binding protein [Anaerotignum propionicum]
MTVPEQAGIDNVDLTCIFGNALENSIEGCLRLPKDYEKEIIVTAKYMDGRLRIQVENSCNEEIVFDGELPKTQKQGGGTGIHSIIYTTEKYDGTYRFSAGNGKFTTQIVLNAHKAIP